MQLNFYDVNLDRIGVLYSWVSLIWDVRYNESGVCQIEAQLTPESAGILVPMTYVTLDEDKTGTVMVLMSIRKTEDERLIANGFDATYLLSRRATTKGRSSTVAEVAIRRYIEDMVPYPNFSLAPRVPITTTYRGDIDGGSVLQVVQKIAEAADIGIRVVKEGKQLKFQCYKPGENPNAKYAVRFGNLFSTAYSNSMVQYANVARVKAKDAQENVFELVVGETEAVGEDRHEVFADLTGETIEENETIEQFKERLTRYAWQRLAEGRETETINFEAYSDSATLGEIVTAMLDCPKVTLKARIIAIKLQNQGNVTTKTLEIGTPIWRN